MDNLGGGGGGGEEGKGYDASRSQIIGGPGLPCPAPPPLPLPTPMVDKGIPAYYTFNEFIQYTLPYT